MAHPYQNKREDKVGHARAKMITKDEGGKVKAIPFSLGKTQDALERLNAAQIPAKSGHTRDFVASRLRSHGIDPLPIAGTEAKYADGGGVSDKMPRGSVRAIPIIKNAAHLNRLIDRADSDDALRSIHRRAVGQGLDTSSIPALKDFKRGGKV